MFCLKSYFRNLVKWIILNPIPTYHQRLLTDPNICRKKQNHHHISKITAIVVFKLTHCTIWINWDCAISVLLWGNIIVFVPFGSSIVNAKSVKSNGKQAYLSFLYQIDENKVSVLYNVECCCEVIFDAPFKENINILVIKSSLHFYFLLHRLHLIMYPI